MHVLNVAEKPSVARTISHLLSQNIQKSAPHKFTPNFSFTYNNQQMIFTSTLGHLTNFDFHPQYKNWADNSPRELFQAQIKVEVNSIEIKNNLIRLAMQAKMVIIWTDCDREGENIAKEIEDVIKMQYPKICIKRAKFHAITLSTIEYAFNNLTNINKHESDAVDARIELDLRLGSAFTRLQSLSFGKGNVISYGPCQIPTLRFVVERMRQREQFVPEKFYSLSLQVDDTDEFLWSRGRVFDENMVINMNNALVDLNAGIIEEVQINKVEKSRPLPLRTVEFQKACASIFKIPAHNVMEIAENLYNKGFISYPRTETESFPANFNFKEICKQLTEYGEYVNKLLSGDFSKPRKGKGDDGAHLPIYPLKCGRGLRDNDRKIYDYVARRYLASISKNAVGEECQVNIRLGRELFKITGLKIKEINYLEVFTFEKWAEKRIKNYKKGVKVILKRETDKETIKNKNVHFCELNITNGVTTAPNYITEPELISLMDKNGIGTDATIAEHIHKILTRNYVYKTSIYFLATGLGIGLISGYEEIGLENFTMPFLRCELEKNLKKICENKAQKQPVISNEIEIYLKYYDFLEEKINIVKSKVKYWIELKPVDGEIDETKKSKHSKLKTNDKQIRQNQNNIDFKQDKFIRLFNDKTNHKDQSNYKSKTKLSDDHNVVFCDCKKKAKRNKVIKDNQNKGREFWCCENYKDGCTYFEWINTPDASILQKCNCGYDVQRKTSRTDQNQGRDFLCCKKAHKPCKYFEWIE